MLNPIKRLYKPNVPARVVNLVVTEEREQAPTAACEVIEYDSVTGWEQWSDSVFVQDFEDSVLTAPAPLSIEGLSTGQPPLDEKTPLDPTAHPSA